MFSIANYGQLYEADENLKRHYRDNYPINSMNPGIGKTSNLKYWDEKADV
ncbi:TPA: hypothetical protein PFE31_001563 [Kluyvera ascorbata]|nr:hypothetical protein [Kluyvera ascorbata]